MLKYILFKRMTLSLGCGLLAVLSGCALDDYLDRPEQPPAEQPAKPTHSLPKESVKPVKPAQKSVCNVPLEGSQEETAESYYVKGERLFNNDDVVSAKKALETATCLNPKHKQAKDLLSLLKRTYP